MENIGKKFNKLTVMSVESRRSKIGHITKYYTCLCDCGNISYPRKQFVTSGKTMSCGCLRKLNEFQLFDNFVKIKPTNNDGYILLDLDDWEYFKNYTLFIGYKGYPAYAINGKSKKIHRKIMNNPKNMIVDHINRNKSDNRKENLRLCTNIENSRNANLSKTNTSGYKGVQRHSRLNRWCAFITIKGKTISLGEFLNIEDAARAREKGELKYFGEFARQEIINKGNYKMNRNKFSTVSFDQYKKDCIRELITPEELRKEYDDITLPKRATERSAGYDFVSPFEFVLKPNESILVPTGIHVELEKYRYLQLAPRSSLGFKYRLQFDNQNPIIDSDYFVALNEGHIMLKLSNCSFDKDNVLTVKKGDRICQGIILSYGLMDDDDEDAKLERTGGIGSTGTGVVNE